METPERHVSFDAIDEPLREDVGMLGRLLGEVLQEQGGQALFEVVESSRRAAIRRRETGGNSKTLQAALRGHDVETARELARAFSMFFSLTNLAEQVHRIRRRRDYLMVSKTAQPGSLLAVMATLADAGLNLEQVKNLLDDTEVVPVFTAHPTQATRRTILAKEQHIARALVDRIEHPQRTADEDQRIDDRLRTQTTLIWQTEEQSAQRLTVGDEVESVLFTLSEVIYRVVPAFSEAVRHAVQETWGGGAAAGLRGPRLVFASWVGGDMDGNPNVGAETIRTTLARHRELIISHYRKEVRRLFQHLSQSLSRVRVSTEVLERIRFGWQRMPEIMNRVPGRYEEMPYRQFLWQIWERLGRTATDGEYSYADVGDFAEDLQLVADSLGRHGGASAGLALVQRLQDRVRTFGFHLATLDLRQDALLHRRVCSELLCDQGFAELSSTERTARLGEALAAGVMPSINQTSEELRKVLDVFRAVGECHSRFGRSSIGPFMVSMAQGLDDILAVLLLARAANLVDAAGFVPLDVAPLFETVLDLEGARKTVHSMLSDPQYRQHLKARGDHQVVMLGYSDSSKISGIAASRWALYQTQEDLVDVCGNEQVRLTLFHGRGGTVGRGGSKTRDGVLATPCGAVRGRLRVTEQGETIEGKYGLRGIAERSLEVAVGAVVQATAFCEITKTPKPEWRKVMQTIAEAGRRAYEDFVHRDDEFVSYFRAATPIDVIERMKIGSRPASRRSGGGVENLRAIPWVFAWTQSRHLIPGWLGVGCGLEAAVQAYGEQILLEMAHEWRFFDTLLGDVAMVLAKADMGIAAVYATLAGDVGGRVFPQIQGAFEHTCELVMTLRGELNLLDREPVLQRSIRLRNPYIDPMSFLQVDLLRRWRQNNRTDTGLENALFETVRGIARGLKNTG